LDDKKNIEKFQIDKRDKLKAISMKISSEEENDTEKRIEDDLANFTKKLNTYYYKIIVSDLKQKMSS
jgi:glutamyl-tRNA reductase